MGLMPSGGLALRLVDYIGRSRDTIGAAVLRSPETAPWDENPAGCALVGAMLDGLCAELEGGDRTALDAWAAAGGDRTLTPAENARLAVLVCALISAGFAAERGQSREIVRYLALRGSELAKAVENAGFDRSVAQDELSAAASRDEAVRSFLAALEAQDTLTCEHSRAVGAWAGRIAKVLGMTPDAREFAVICGTVHDVGKINTPKSILMKTGPLSDEEWVEMRNHPEAGARMVERIGPIRDAAPIVRAHHERIDGTGYPDGLAGDEIPLVARIVAVADSFHAMITKRPYRDAMSIPAVLEVLANGRGGQWDPSVVEAMISIVRPAAAQSKLRLLRLA